VRKISNPTGIGSEVAKITFWPPFSTVLWMRIEYESGSSILGRVADPGPGSGAFLIPDLGSWIPTPYFLELSDKFLGKKFYNSLKTGPNIFLKYLKIK
jgi:hypothetical protein